MLSKLIAILPALAALTSPAWAQGEPSFNCSQAATDVEHAICDDKALSEEDRAIAVSYKSLIDAVVEQGLDPALADALRADQRNFIAIRDEGFGLEHIPEARRLETLFDSMQFRAEFLAWINVTPPDDFVGTWRNAYGILTIARSDDGLVLEANASDQIIGSWVCQVDGPLNLSADGTATVGTDSGAVRLVRDKGFLTLTDAKPNATQDYCGNGGAMGGAYFYIGAADD